MKPRPIGVPNRPRPSSGRVRALALGGVVVAEPAMSIKSQPPATSPFHKRSSVAPPVRLVTTETKKTPPVPPKRNSGGGLTRPGLR